MRGKIVIRLVGPFTSRQKALVTKRTSVNPDNVITAYQWLKKNNYYYQDIIILERTEILQPIIIDKDM